MAATRQSIAVPLFVDEKPFLWIDVADRTPADLRRVGVGLLDPEPLPHPWGRSLGRARAEGRFHDDAQDALSRLQAALRTLLKHGFHGLFGPPLALMSDSSAPLLCQLGATSTQALKIPRNSHNRRVFYGLATTVIL